MHVAISGAPVLAAGVPLTLRVTPDPDLPLEARLRAPSQSSGDAPGEWFALFAESQGERTVYAHSLMLPAAGAWGLDVRAGADIASFSFQVWPAARAFVEPVGELAQRGVVLRDSEEPFELTLVDARHRRVAPPPDALARVETPTVTQTRALIVEADGEGGRLLLPGPWAEEGRIEITLLSESLEIGEGSARPVALLVVPPEEADVYGLASPREEERGVAAAPAILLLLAIAALALLTRGRP